MSIKNELLKVISKTIKDSWKSAPFDKTYEGRIVEKLTDDKYKVSFNGVKFTAKTIDKNKTYNPNEIVCVLAPQNNHKNLFIL